ncbi:MAG: hypothetical protein LQ345_001951 [Seirophora villosa]|nr:MAG: hypothetical protein LQ345_001951 [Seirophora villosa]
MTATDAAEQVSLQRLPGSFPAATLEPVAIGTAEGDQVALGTTTSGAGKTHTHLLGAAAVIAPGMDEYQQAQQSVNSIEDGWNLIEAERKQGGSVMGEEGTKDFVHTEGKTIADEGADWDFCIYKDVVVLLAGK